jgi:hypothetical protein
VNRELGRVGRRMETGISRERQVPKKRVCSGIARAEIEVNRAALHEYDRMVTVLAVRRRSQAKHVFGFDLLHDLLKAESRNVVAFINNDMPVFGDKVLHFAFTLQALKQGDVDASAAGCFAASDLPDCLYGKIQERD